MKTFINAPSSYPVDVSAATVIALLKQLDHDSQWIGINLSSRWTMQFRTDADENNEKIYMELLDTKSKTFKWKVLSFKEAESLVKEVLGHGKPSQHFRKLAKAWKEEDLNGAEPDNENEEDEVAPLGHGEHWEAMGVQNDGTFAFIQETFEGQDELIHLIDHPFVEDDDDDELWVIPRMKKIGSIQWISLWGATLKDAKEDRRIFLTGFPAFTNSTQWLMHFQQENDAYGSYERVFEMKTLTSHQLEFFAPDYSLQSFRLVEERLFIFQVNALALRMAKSPEQGDFRYISISNHDHASLTGKIMEATPIKPQPRFKGWRLRIECLPETGFERDLIVYAFPPCLDKGYRPRKNDLITATVWLQASVDRAATPDEITAWELEREKWPREAD